MNPKQVKDLCVIIPFRFGNQDLPNKNIIKIHDKFLFQRSLNHALFLKSFINLQICLSTNKPEILSKVAGFSNLFNLSKLSRNNKNELALSDFSIDIHKRNHKLSSKKSPINVTLSNIRESYLNQNIFFKNWLLLQPTSPFRSKSDLKHIVDYISCNYDNKNEHSLISVKNVDGNHPARMYSEKNGKLISLAGMEKLTRNRRQDLDRIYIRDGGFYLFSDAIAKKNKLFSKNPDFFIRNYPWNINIDSRYDLAAALSIEKLEVISDPNNKLLNKLN
jgi:CMP-N-acetylneuraminic acid synthetase